MKRQLRPYTVEIKSPRLRSSSSRLDPAVIDLFPEDLPVRDVLEDLAQETRTGTSHKSEAMREAERIFGGLKAAAVELSPAQSAVPSFRLIGSPDILPRARTAVSDVSEPNRPVPEVRRPRVLPDLREQAPSLGPPAPTEPVRAHPITRSSTSPRKSRKRPTATAEAPASAIPSPEPLLASRADGERLLSLALTSLVHSRLALTVATGEQEQPRRRALRQLPRGERWKTRRLPDVCQARPRWR
jgi:hypothetical protein